MAEIPPGAVASPGRRLAGYVIDLLLVGSPFLVLVLTSSEIDIDNRVFNTPSWITWCGWAVWLLYEILLTTRDGQTIGKRVMHTRVVCIDTHHSPTIGPATVRAILARLLSLIPIIGAVAAAAAYLPVAWRSDRRGVHDLLAGTTVVTSDY